MPSGNDEGVERGHRVEVAERDAELVAGDDPLIGDLAEDAVVMPVLVAAGHAAEIGIIAVLLHGVARVAESLEIVRLVRTSVVAGHDVIDFEGLVLGRDAAEFASVVRPLQYLVAEGARDISRGFSPVRPGVLALFQIGCDPLIADGFEFPIPLSV